MTEESKKACADFYANGHVQIGDRRVTARWRGETVFDVRFNDDGTFDCRTGAPILSATPEGDLISRAAQALDDGLWAIQNMAAILGAHRITGTLTDPSDDMRSVLAALRAHPAPAIEAQPVAWPIRLPVLSEELYDQYVAMSAQTHEHHVRAYAREAIQADRMRAHPSDAESLRGEVK